MKIIVVECKKSRFDGKCDSAMGFCCGFGRYKKRPKQGPQLDVGEGGLEPPNGFPDRFTVCCNCHYATPP